MINVEALNQKKADIMAKIAQAIKDDNQEEFSQAFNEFMQLIETAVTAEARGLIQSTDNTILAGRGVRALTSQEKEYYQKLITAMGSDIPQQALTSISAVFPETVLNAVFEDLIEEHPLLSMIDFQNTAVLLRYLYSTADARFLSTWGPLTGTITQEVGSTFRELSLEQTKLSAYLSIYRPMLDLGPEWLDRYIRAILAEAIANGLENGMINGRGVVDAGADAGAAPAIFEPIGMIRDVATAPTNGVGYNKKTAIPIASFSPQEYLPLIKNLVELKTSAGANRLYRRVTEVMLLVNPADYLTKIAPATMYRQPDGTYVSDILPFPTRIVQSAYVEAGKAILGLPKRYLMAMGTGKDGRIEYSDHYQFIQDQRFYLIKLYGNGRPVDNTSFIVLDISGVKPIVPPVKVVPLRDATLATLTVTSSDGDASLDPASITVAGNVHYYEVELKAKAAKAIKVNATATDSSNAVLTAKLNGDNYTLNADMKADILEGRNDIIITVTNGEDVERYVLIVDYTDTTI